MKESENLRLWTPNYPLEPEKHKREEQMPHSGTCWSQIWNTFTVSLFSDIPRRCCSGMWALLLRMRQIPERA